MLSDRIKLALEKSGITQAQLARACGVKPPSVNGWLNGKSKYLRGENLLAAAKALGVSHHWLATGKGLMVEDSDSEHVDAGRSTTQPDGSHLFYKMAKPPSIRQAFERIASTLAQLSEPDRETIALLMRQLCDRPDSQKTIDQLVLASTPESEQTPESASRTRA